MLIGQLSAVSCGRFAGSIDLRRVFQYDDRTDDLVVCVLVRVGFLELGALEALRQLLDGGSGIALLDALEFIGSGLVRCEGGADAAEYHDQSQCECDYTLELFHWFVSFSFIFFWMEMRSRGLSESASESIRYILVAILPALFKNVQWLFPDFYTKFNGLKRLFCE